jgi:hypothetical protein
MAKHILRYRAFCTAAKFEDRRMRMATGRRVEPRGKARGKDPCDAASLADYHLLINAGAEAGTPSHGAVGVN